MHGLRDLRGKLDTPERSLQIQRLLVLHDQVSRPGDLNVICGDFNVEPGSETLAVLAKAGFTELVTGMGFSGTRNALYQKSGRFADYMLIDQPKDVRHFDVLYHSLVSDHCPLALDL